MSQIKFLFLSAALLALSSCGSSQYINSAQVSSHVSNGDEFATLVTNINSSALSLPSLSLPIIDLKNPSVDYGSISIAPSLDGKSTDLTINVDMTVALKLPAAGSNISLPNGTSLPIGGIDLTKTMEFAIGNTGSKVYLELDTVNKKAFVGTALVISQFKVGTVIDLFIPFSSNSISGTAGIFTGTTSGQSGIGVFADLSSVLSSKLTGNAQMLRAASVTSESATPHQFLAVTPSSRNQYKVQSMLLDLNSKKAHLDVR